MPDRGGTVAAGKRSDITSLLVVSSHIWLVLMPVYLAVAVQPGPVIVLLWLWYGSLQQGLLNMMHECAHLHVFKSRRGSEILANWVLGPLMVVSFARYREVHWAHHTNLGQTGDPKYSYRCDIRGWRFLAFVVRSLLLIESARKLLYVHGDRAASKRTEPPGLWIARTLAFHGVFVASLLLTAWLARGLGLTEAAKAVALGYGVVYVYGVTSLTVMMANLRAIAEHQIRTDGAQQEGAAALRNLRSSLLTHLIFGAYGFSEHATHHWDPGVPYYRLVAETGRWEVANPRARPAFGYVAALYQSITQAEVSPSVGSSPAAAEGTAVPNR